MFNIVIIGAGVIGLSIARAIGEKTNLSVLIIDKEDGIGRGISSRNSEVIHSGIYYDPKSLKTKYCIGSQILRYKIFNVIGKRLLRTRPTPQLKQSTFSRLCC